jgi:hypothetical protein
LNLTSYLYHIPFSTFVNRAPLFGIHGLRRDISATMLAAAITRKGAIAAPLSRLARGVCRGGRSAPILRGMALSPQQLRRHSMLLLAHARKLRADAEEARKRAVAIRERITTGGRISRSEAPSSGGNSPPAEVDSKRAAEAAPRGQSARRLLPPTAHRCEPPAAR